MHARTRAQIITAKEIASAMCYLHGCNILHGDLTSNNILLAGGEKDQRMFVSKVADFGECAWGGLTFVSKVADIGGWVLCPATLCSASDFASCALPATRFSARRLCLCVVCLHLCCLPVPFSFFDAPPAPLCLLPTPCRPLTVSKTDRGYGQGVGRCVELGMQGRGTKHRHITHASKPRGARCRGVPATNVRNCR